VQHITIYREPGRFAGWPANYGIWSWGDEIVVGFALGYHKSDAGFHARDKDRPFVTMQARSLSGGLTWVVKPTPCRTPGGRGLSADEHMRPNMGIGQVIQTEGIHPSPGDIDFLRPGFAMMCARSGLKAGARSWFYYSYDRCSTWEGPFALPMFGQAGIAARTDYLVLGPSECMLFLTAAKADGDEGHVFCAKTKDGGKSFRFVSWIGPEPKGFAIMPASVRLPGSRILVAVRCRESGRNWIDLYGSDDRGRTWEYMNKPVANTGVGGNPPTLMKLVDGRLLLTYGYRDPPFEMRAKLSSDEGESWGQEVVLRTGGGNHDIGYPRTVQRSDGKVVTVYYFNDHPEGERYIAATLWEP